MAAQAYVENFALKIFNNGVQVIDANRATRYLTHSTNPTTSYAKPLTSRSQTADTLLAGATLLEVCQVFGDLDAEVPPLSSYSLKYLN